VNREQLIADLRQAEGVRDRVYDDATGSPIEPNSLVKGHPSVGVGHRLDQPLAPILITAILDQDIVDAITDLNRSIPWWISLPESAQRALIELRFSMGLSGLLGFHRMLHSLSQHQRHSAACELEASHWAVQVGPTRFKRVAELLRA